MPISTPTQQKILHALTKASKKFVESETLPLTDILIQINQESGELLIFDEDEVELTRCVVEEWIGNEEEDFYTSVQHDLECLLQENKALVEDFNILKPYSFVLLDDEKEVIADLYLVDDETLQINSNLMEGLDEDLEKFWQELFKE